METHEIQQKILELMDDGRERLSSEIADHFKRQGTPVPEEIITANCQGLRAKGELFYDKMPDGHLGAWCSEPYGGTKQPSVPPFSGDWVLKLVAERRGVKMADLIGPDVYKRAVEARQEAMSLLEDEGASIDQIRKIFGRSRETVYRSIRLHRLRLRAMQKQGRVA